MTISIQQAIETLERFQNPEPWEPKITDRAYEALQMAISALEFKERYDQFWEEVKAAGMKGEETEIRHSGRVFRIREVAQ